MKKGTIYTLLLGVVLMFATACNKEVDSGATHSMSESITDVNYGNNARSVITDDVEDWGETISTTEGATRIADFATEFPNMHSKEQLNKSNWDVIRAVEGMKGVGIAPSDSCGHVVFAMDEDDHPIMSTVYKLDANGGVSLSTSEADDDLDSDINGDTIFPGTVTLGYEVLDAIAAQSGFKGFSFYNGLDDLGDDEWSFDILVRAYSDEGDDFGTTGTTGAKDGCRKWVPATIVDNLYISGHWEECGALATMVWNITH